MDDPLPVLTLNVMVNGEMVPEGEQVPVTEAFPVTPVVEIDSVTFAAELVCTVSAENASITGGGTTVTVTLDGWPPVPLDTDALVVAFVTVNV